MERDIAAARKRRRGGEAGRGGAGEGGAERFAAAAFRDPARLAPKIAFAEARACCRGRSAAMSRANSGPRTATAGRRAAFRSARARPRLVVSPADGWVAFAGPFRSFGRLLIINAGGGYYLFLAGMDQINVEVGQFVLAGEPVATMGETSSVSPAAGASNRATPCSM